MRIVIVGLVALSVAGCAQQPSQAELEYKAYDRVLSEKVASGKLSPAEADLARQQYAGNLRTRESGIAASYGVANSNNTYAQNSSMAMGLALMCAGQRGGHC
jgi:hypothetical protein